MGDYLEKYLFYKLVPPQVCVPDCAMDNSKDDN